LGVCFKLQSSLQAVIEEREMLMAEALRIAEASGAAPEGRMTLPRMPSQAMLLAPNRELVVQVVTLYVYISVSIYLYLYLSIYLSISLSFFLSVYVSIDRPIDRCINLAIHLSE